MSVACMMPRTGKDGLIDQTEWDRTPQLIGTTVTKTLCARHKQLEFGEALCSIFVTWKSRLGTSIMK